MDVALLYFNFSFDKMSGSSKYVLDLGNALASIGVNTYVICNRPSKNYDVKFTPVYIDSPIASCSSFLEEISNMSAFNKATELYSNALKELAKKGNLDIVNCQHCLYGAIPALELKKTNGTPFVATCHGSEVNEVMGTPCEKYLDASREADRIIATTKYFKTRLEKIFPGMSIDVITPGVNTELFRPAENKSSLRSSLGLPENKPILIFVGRLVEEKGVFELLRMFKIINKESGAKLIIIGKGRCEQDIRKMAADLNISKDIVFRIGVSDIEKAALYSSADVLLFPSTWEEPFGMVVTEAMSAGLPVVANDVGGISQIAPGIVNLVPKNDWDHFIKTTLELLSDRKRCAELGKKGRDIVLKRYSWEIIAKNFVEVYKDVIDQTS